jgi:hypothetical protein
MNRQFNQNILEQWFLENVRHEAEMYNLSLQNKGKKQTQKTIDKAKVLAKIEKLKNLYLNDMIPLSIYEKDYKSLAALLEEANIKEKEFERKPINLAQFDNLRGSYEKLDPQHRKAFWSRIIKKVVINKDGEKNITLNTP